jgi:acetyl esterase/lipase
MATWAHDAADLVTKVAADLDVAESDVIFIGHSMKGGLALQVGLLTNAAHIVVGAPTLAGGTVTEQIYLGTKARGRTGDLVEFIYTATGMAEEPHNRDAIDNLIPDSVATARHRAHLEIFSAPSDPFWGAALEFRDSLADHPTLECTVIEAEYRNHNTMGPAYLRFIRAWLLSVVRPAPAEAAISAPSPAPGAERKHAAEVALAYWEILGRAPDPQGLKFHVIELEHGGSLDTLRDHLVDSPEARVKLAAWPKTIFHGPSHEIPYATQPLEGSHRLVVTLPGIGIGRFIPNAGDPALSAVAMNRLAIGMSADRPQRSEELRDWVRDAAELVQHEATELGVDPTDVVCVGHSFQGALALLVGLKAKVGRIIVGAPPVNLGSVLSRPSGGQPIEVQVLYDRLQAASGVVDDPTAAERLDELIVGAARQADHAADLEIFVSRSDMFWAAGETFVASLADHPTLRCSLVEATYADHNAMEPAYREYLQEGLRALVPTTRLTADG